MILERLRYRGPFFAVWLVLVACERLPDPAPRRPSSPGEGDTAARAEEVLQRGWFANDEEREALRDSLPYEQITLERTHCFGRCPVFTMTLHRTGRAELAARAFLPERGDFEGEIHLSSYARLCRTIERLELERLEPEQPRVVFDSPKTIVTLRRGDQELRFERFAWGMVVELWAVGELLDALREKIRWERVR